MDSSNVIAVILAAGKSTRMKSELPKVLHPICGIPMIEHVLNAVREAGVKETIVVVGHKAEQVKQALSGQSGIKFALQEEQNGTGHAVMMCKEHLINHKGSILILAGDTPLLKSSSLKGLLEEQASNNAACIVGTASTENNHGLGRIIRDEENQFLRIVEEKDATDEQRQVQEINTGCFAFDGPSLFEALNEVRSDNVQGELYLTDCAEILRNKGKTVLAAEKLSILEAKGINTQEQLAEVEQIMLAQK